MLTLAVDIFDEHFIAWVVMGDLLLIAAVWALFRRTFIGAVRAAMKPTEDKVTALVAKADSLAKVQSAHTETLGALQSQVMKIEYQVQPNRGSSLRDTANRTEATVKELDTKVDGLSDRMARIEGSQDRQERGNRGS